MHDLLRCRQSVPCRRRLLGVAVSLAAMLLLGVAPLQAKTIKIGFVGGLSGFCAATIQAGKQGVEMAVDEINAAGGVNGDKIEVIYRDSKSKPDEGAKQARDLLENEKVDLLTGPCSSSVWLAISPLAKDHKVPIFSFAAKSHRATMDFGHPYIYQTQSNSMMDANAMAEYTAANGWKNVVTIGLDYEWGHQTVGQYVERLKELDSGVQVKKQLWPKFGESNMNSFITATLSEKPDAVLAATFGPTSTSLIKQGNTYGLFSRTNVVTIMPVEVLAALGKDMPDGIHGLGAAPFFALGTKSGEEFVQRFRARFNEYPKDYAVQSYDATKHFAEGMRRAGGTDPDKLRETMSSFTYNGIRGPLTFRRIDNQASAPGYIGVTRQSSDYPFPILADVKIIPGDKTWGNEALVEKLRAEAMK